MLETIGVKSIVHFVVILPASTINVMERSPITSSCYSHLGLRVKQSIPHRLIGWSHHEMSRRVNEYIHQNTNIGSVVHFIVAHLTYFRRHSVTSFDLKIIQKWNTSRTFVCIAKFWITYADSNKSEYRFGQFPWIPKGVSNVGSVVNYFSSVTGIRTAQATELTTHRSSFTFINFDFHFLPNDSTR